ncbi:hypothetical protein AE07_02331 [Enterobacter cloacae BWH 43]|nr:hypothetical protein AE07_02331 [Enterobacter cloacae BWH 43]
MIPDSVLATIFPHCHILVIIFMIEMKQLRDKASDLTAF